MGQCLFAVANVFRLASRPDSVIVVTDCPLCAAPPVLVGQLLEFRHPAGGVARAVVSGIEFADPPNPDRPFAFLVRPDGEAVGVGAEVWSLVGCAPDAEPGSVFSSGDS